MTPTEMQRRLDSIFSKLWANRHGVHESWGASSYCYHPTYIRRGPLLLRGGTRFSDMWVLNPGDCEVIPVSGDPRVRCDTFPVIKGEVIAVCRIFFKVSLQDEGPWLQYLAEEIPKMEAELEEIYKQREEAKRKAKEERIAKRRAELEAAAALFEKGGF